MLTAHKIQRYIQASLRRPDHSKLLAISQEDVQSVIDEIWKVLDSAALPVHISDTDSEFFKYRNKLRKLALKIAIAYDILPSTLTLRGVTQDNDGSRAGVGGFADIYLGRFREMKVALKCIRGITTATEEGREITKHFYRESLLWKNLIHPSIVEFHGIADDVFKDTICMVLPWMDNGSLRHYVAASRKVGQLVGEKYLEEINRWLYQIAEGLAYLHAEGLVHGDLHGGNVLIDSELNARLTDFGMSLITEASSYGYASTHGGGAIRWTAPELIDPDEFDMENTRPTPASDIFSFACMLIELYSGSPPWDSLSNNQVQRRYVKGQRPDRPHLPDGDLMSDDMWSLTKSCWAHLAKDRPTAKQVAEAMVVLADIQLSDVEEAGSDDQEVEGEESEDIPAGTASPTKSDSDGEFVEELRDSGPSSPQGSRPVSPSAPATDPESEEDGLEENLSVRIRRSLYRSGAVYAPRNDGLTNDPSDLSRDFIIPVIRQ